MLRQFNGIVDGRRIELERETGLPAGTPVSVQIDPSPISREEFCRAVDEACGAWADDDSIDAIFEEIIASRRRSMPREVDLDAPSGH